MSKLPLVALLLAACTGECPAPSTYTSLRLDPSMPAEVQKAFRVAASEWELAAPVIIPIGGPGEPNVFMADSLPPGQRGLCDYCAGTIVISPITRPAMLGSVILHEVGHWAGVDGHTDSGLMVPLADRQWGCVDRVSAGWLGGKGTCDE